MFRLTTLALMAVLIFIQLSSIECKKDGSKKKKGCTFNGRTLKPGQNVGDTLQPADQKTYDDFCVKLVCIKVKRKGAERKNGGGGKGKYALVAEAIEGCIPIECEGPAPCGGGRSSPQKSNITDQPDICRKGCTKEMMEVCGSDGITYENPCRLNQTRICKGINVVLKHPGKCEGVTDNTMKCKPCNKRKVDPVCGDDGKTYASACVLDYENCRNGKDVKQVKKGKCEGDKKRKLRRPKRELFGKNKGKGKKKQCTYNGRKMGENRVQNLYIHCTQLKCNKVKKSVKLEIQQNIYCRCCYGKEKS